MFQNSTLKLTGVQYQNENRKKPKKKKTRNALENVSLKKNQ